MSVRKLASGLDRAAACRYVNEMQRAGIPERALEECLPQIPAGERSIMIAGGELISIKARSCFVEQGSASERALLVLDGTFSIFRKGKTKRSLLVGRGGAGDLVGELGCLLDMPHSVEALAETNLLALSWKADAFNKLLRGCPEFNQYVLARLARIILHADEQRQALVENDIPTRVIGYLHERSIVLPDGYRVVAPKPRNTDIARSLGVTREAVARAVSLLVQSQELVVEKSQLKLVSRAGRGGELVER